MVETARYFMFLLFSILVYMIIWDVGGNNIKEHIAAIKFTRNILRITGFTESCEGSSSFVYLKTHKTGSNTLKNILQKHRRRHGFENEIENFPSPFCGGYPGYFREKYAVYEKNFTPDILMRHIRFNETAVKALMNKKAKYITIMRNPLRQFESAFQYYYGQHTKESLRIWKNSNPVTCHGQPYLQITGKLGVNLSNYIELAENASFDKLAWYFRSRNYQSFDFGLDPWNSSREYLFNESRKLNSIFDLVLIIEHLLESLVLLKELLCMEWSDIVPSEWNKGHYESYTYTNREEEIVRKLNIQDMVLYNFFNKTLWRKVDIYGRERMKNDVAILEDLIKNQNNSVKQKKTFGKRRRSRSQYDYVRNIEDYLSRYNKKHNLNMGSLLREISQYMVNNSGWCPHNANF